MHRDDHDALTALLLALLNGKLSTAEFCRDVDTVVLRVLDPHFGPQSERNVLTGLHDVTRRYADPGDGPFKRPDNASAQDVEKAAQDALEALMDGREVALTRQGQVPGPHMPVPGERVGVRITIDPEAVVRNWRRLSAISRGECGAVVKGNAYGLGIDVVTPPLAQAGCRTFFVATEAEGFLLRALLPEAVIYVLNGIFGDPGPAIRAGLRPFLSCPAALTEWPSVDTEHAPPFALNVNTGMNRLGLSLDEALATAAKPVLVASHFASADTPDHPQNADQEAAFSTVRQAFAATPASLANSAALLTRPQAHYDLTRPGIALYGGASAPTDTAIEPTVRLEARIVQVRQAKAGETVGYGAAERLERDSRIAIASIGYADGYLRQAGGSDSKSGAPVAVNGVRTRLLGRVSMDLIAVDVTAIDCARGDWVELFGSTVPLDEAADAAGTIGYELLTGLSRRATRTIGAL